MMKTRRIIAEIGINHNGRIDTARRLVSAAAETRLWGVKFQYRNLDNAYTDGVREIGDEILTREIARNYIAPRELIALAQFGRSLGLSAGISFFDTADMGDFGDDLAAFDFLKLPSAELTNAPLVDRMLETGRDVFISTGCHSEAEIEAALGRLSLNNWIPLHCISNYPTALQNARLGYLTYMLRRFKRDVGYSSHDENWEVCLLALQLGASVIERHITLDKQAEGLDHSTSSTPDEFLKLSSFTENMDLILAGDAPRVVNQGELLNRQNLGRSFFASRDIEAGETVTVDHLSYRSPQVGLLREEIGHFVGQPAIKRVAKGQPISRTVFCRPEPLPDAVLEFARAHQLALPVRLHDIAFFEKEIPTQSYEFHLSFAEALSRPDAASYRPANRYSIHLPDYVNSTQLIDVLSPSADQRAASHDILDRTADFASALQQRTGRQVPVVGSFSVVHANRRDFFAAHAEVLHRHRQRGVVIMPQWLPPIAWYFGGSVRLHAMNDSVDADLLAEFDLTCCMDFSHLIMGRNFSGFSIDAILERLAGRIGHLHLADAAGIDGEGVQIGEGEPENLGVVRRALRYDCLKVIEVWQGHLDAGARFREALTRLARLDHGL